jgi:hypothetical protein
MTDISRLKYIQWRPIGVCDTGVGKERKAKMFSRTDLAKVTSPEVNRGNWRQQPEVLQLIQSYAHDLEGISNLTDEMLSPEIAEIKLVGAVLGHEQTPNLNQESADGRVQFFQLSFQDGKTKKVSSKNWKKWLIWLMIAVVVFLGMTSMFLIASRFSLLSLNSSKKSVSVCSTNRQEAKYSEHLRDIRKSLVFELNRLPAWSTFNVARTYCIGGKMSIKQQEQRLLQCLLKVRNRTKNIPPASRPSLNKIEACASTLCQRELPHLSEFCKRL